MNQQRPNLHLSHKEMIFDLWRLMDKEHHKLRQDSVPIKEDDSFMFHLYLSDRDDEDRLILPKVFVTLEYLLGKSSQWFDEYKGSFYFPTLLLFQKPQSKFFYLFDISDYRGSLSFRWYRVLENGNDGYDLYTYQDPFELEFSQEEMRTFLSYFYGYLKGVASWLCRDFSTPFLKKIASNIIIYGYGEDGFFEKDFQVTEDYEQAIADFENKYGNLTIEHQIYELKSLLQEITRDGDH